MADGSINGDVNSLYPEDTSRWLEYKIRFGIQGDKLKFLVTLVTENGNGWFGIGFAPADDGMDGKLIGLAMLLLADFIIGTLSSNTTNLGNYISNGYQPPILDKDQNPARLLMIPHTKLNSIVLSLRTVQTGSRLSKVR